MSDMSPGPVLDGPPAGAPADVAPDGGGDAGGSGFSMKKALLIGGVLIVALLLYRWYMNRNGSSSANGSASAAGPVVGNATDPSTWLVSTGSASPMLYNPYSTNQDSGASSNGTADPLTTAVQSIADNIGNLGKAAGAADTVGTVSGPIAPSSAPTPVAVTPVPAAPKPVAVAVKPAAGLSTHQKNVLAHPSQFAAEYKTLYASLSTHQKNILAHPGNFTAAQRTAAGL